MSIKKTTSSDQSGAIIMAFDNGDLAALELIKKKWKFKDEESLLRFALAVLVKADGSSSISVKNESGGEVDLKPSTDLLLKE
jgi:hypothetical protein